MRKNADKITYSPSDLVRYVASPFASWMDRYYLENPKAVTPDEETEDQKLIAETGNEHERSMFEEFRASTKVVEIPKEDFQAARKATLTAIESHAPIIYQAALNDERFAGFADFVVLDESECYQIWDTKLARSPKPYYAIQLCCYSEMFAVTTGGDLPEKFGIILGTKDRVEFRVEDFIHYYRCVKSKFLEMQDSFTNDIGDRPEPLPGADHGRWTSHADKFFDDSDHLVRVAGITIGQIKKLKLAGITTMAQLAEASRKSVPKLAAGSLVKLVTQARLQCATRDDRAKDADAPARYELLTQFGASGEPVGLATLPPTDPADVFFDMEGYPLVPGGLEYLFGAISVNPKGGDLEFHDWWAHDRNEEKTAFEGFVDWVHKRWKENPKMHIYHYAAYEVNAVSRLSTRHDTRQDEVDDLLRAGVFVDLYKVVRHGLCIGEDSYSIKSVEHLYRPKRTTDVATAMDSIVQYAHWMGSEQSPEWKDSVILKSIRDYNEDDCKSTVELVVWLRKLAAKNGISFLTHSIGTITNDSSSTKELSPDVIARKEAVDNLRKQGDPLALALADVIDFHRREQKPMWWRMFDRTEATDEELCDDSGCIQGVEATGSPVTEKLSLVQSYSFDPSQECKLKVDDKVMFAHNIDGKFTVTDLDLENGALKLKMSKKALDEKFKGSFPQVGSLIPDEFVSAKPIQIALTDVGNKHLSNALHAPVTALLTRTVPAEVLQGADETTIKAATRIAGGMSGACLVIQGPPGTGKTYTAAQVITSLLDAGKKVGVTSNSHKAILNLLSACGEAAKESGSTLRGIKVGGEKDEDFFKANPGLQFIQSSKDAVGAYVSGVVGGTAWLFTIPEWEDKLDFLFIDEAGQVSLANAIAVARSAKNVVLLGDQMQLEQPIQGTHPGDAGLSSLQYALKDLKASKEDLPVFHAVVPDDYGLFLGESRRMHPSVCSFVSEIVYEGRLGSHPDTANQRIAVPKNAKFVTQESGVVFVGVEHDGNIQQSEEEVSRVKAVYDEMVGRPYTASDGKTKDLTIENFLFIAPYNAQVRALQAALPVGARVGSVDKFQGQEAPVCILSLCSSYGEYGSRGLAFILDRNRINVALSRAQCLAVVVADPRIASATAGSISEMMLLNVFCKLVKNREHRSG